MGPLAVLQAVEIGVHICGIRGVSYRALAFSWLLRCHLMISSYMVQDTAEFKDFRTSRTAMPSKKPIAPSSCTYTTITMLMHTLTKPGKMGFSLTAMTFFAELQRFLYTSGFSCIRVFSISNGCVNDVAATPANTP